MDGRDAPDAHNETIREEFTRQSAGFNAAPAMSGAGALGALVDLLPAEPGQRWLEVACGPGIVTRAIAPRVGEVRGIDLTPAMIQLAEREALSAGLSNTCFALGDATAIDEPNGFFDGAVTRFSLHHIPVPERVIAEMARVVKPGGWVAVADGVADADQEAAAWREELERLRDTSHWAFPALSRLHTAGEAAGLELVEERMVDLQIPFDDWLERGEAGAEREELIRELAERPPASATTTHLAVVNGRRQLVFAYWLSLWRAR